MASKTKLDAIATMEFDWLDCLELTQADTVDQPAIDTDDLSAASFDAGHKPSGKVVANNNSLATAQASVVSMVNLDAASPWPPLQSKDLQSLCQWMLMPMTWLPW